MAGGLGVGKTELCRALAESFGYTSILEDLRQNPLLESFYQDMESMAFPSQMVFVCSKFENILHADPRKANIVDYSVVNGRTYATALLRDKDPEALRLITESYDYLERKLGPADLLLYLDCPVDTQLARIRSRRRDSEQGLTAVYLERFNGVMQELLNSERQKGRAVLVIPDNTVTGQEWEAHVAGVHGRVSLALHNLARGRAPAPRFS